jgi:copper transport protein
VAIVVGVVVLAAAPASAHAILVASSPGDRAQLASAPASVSLTFNENVTVPIGSIRAFDAKGARVDNGNFTPRGNTVSVGLNAGLGDGAYVVTWRVISADSHPVRGAFTFTVGSAAPASDSLVSSVFDQGSDRTYEVAGAIARGLAYTGTLLAAGGALFLAIVHDGFGDGRRLTRIVLAAAAVGALGLLLEMPIEAALATGLGVGAIIKPGVLGNVSSDGVGLATAMGMIGLVVIALAVVRIRVRLVLVLGGLAAAVSFAFAGHTAQTDPRWLAVAADVVHVLVGAAWFGGAVLLVSTLRARRAGDADPVAAGKVVARFSRLATVCVLAIAISGVTLAWIEVRAWRALTGTTYGRLVIAKAVLVSLIALIGMYNHYRLVPALQKASAAGRNAWQHLTRTVRVEAVGMVVVLGLTAVLVNVTPARSAAGIGTIFSETKPIGANSVNLVVDPNRAGTNSIHLYLLDATGRPAPVAVSVTLDLSLPANEIGPIVRQPFVAGPGHYQLDGGDLSLPGQWTVVVRVQVSKFEEQTATFTDNVNP